MSALSSIESATAAFFTKGDSATAGLSISNIDIGKIIEIVSAIVQAAPAIEQGIASAAPFVEAISEMIANGGKPSDEQWAALKARLDSGSAILTSAEDVAQAELDAAAAATALGDGPADVPAAENLLETSVPAEPALVTGKKGK